MLLSFDDYQNKFGGIQVTDENEFKKLESSTESLFNALTNMFYVKHDIDAILMNIALNCFARP